MSFPTESLQDKLSGYEEKLQKLNTLLSSDEKNEELLKLKAKLVSSMDTIRLAIVAAATVPTKPIVPIQPQQVSYGTPAAPLATSLPFLVSVPRTSDTLPTVVVGVGSSHPLPAAPPKGAYNNQIPAAPTGSAAGKPAFRMVTAVGGGVKRPHSSLSSAPLK